MSALQSIDVGAIAELVVQESRSAYGSMWASLRKDQQGLLERLTREISKEYMAYALGPPERRQECVDNLRSLKNGLAALEAARAIRVYRTTIALVGRVLAGVLKAAAKGAVGL